MKSSFKFTAALVAVALVMGIGATALLVAMAPALAAAPRRAPPLAAGDAWSFGLLAAALSTALAALGAGFAVARVGTAAIGALAEKPELFGRLLIFVGPRGRHRDLRPHRVDPDPQPPRLMRSPDLSRRRSDRRRLPVGRGTGAQHLRLGEASAAFDEACAIAPLVLVSAAVAVHIDAGQLRAALAALQPLVLIVPDAQGEVPRPDLAARLRGQLGMEA